MNINNNGGDNVTDSHKNFDSYVPSTEYVLQLNKNDVLCGRGSGPNDHIGNIRFRDQVSGHRIQYMKTSKRKDKDRIARDILNSVRKCAEPPGRFLKKLGGRVVKDVGFAKGVDVWMEVDEGTALEKVKQALRQNRSLETDDKNRNDEPNLTEENEKYSQPIGLVDEGNRAPSNFRKLESNISTLPSTGRYDQGIDTSGIPDPHLFPTPIKLPEDSDVQRNDTRLKAEDGFGNAHWYSAKSQPAFAIPPLNFQGSNIQRSVNRASPIQSCDIKTEGERDGSRLHDSTFSKLSVGTNGNSYSSQLHKSDFKQTDRELLTNLQNKYGDKANSQIPRSENYLQFNKMNVPSKINASNDNNLSRLEIDPNLFSKKQSNVNISYLHNQTPAAPREISKHQSSGLYPTLSDSDIAPIPLSHQLDGNSAMKMSTDVKPQNKTSRRHTDPILRQSFLNAQYTTFQSLEASHQRHQSQRDTGTDLGRLENISEQDKGNPNSFTDPEEMQMMAERILTALNVQKSSDRSSATEMLEQYFKDSGSDVMEALRSSDKSNVSQLLEKLLMYSSSTDIPTEIDSNANIIKNDNSIPPIASTGPDHFSSLKSSGFSDMSFSFTDLSVELSSIRNSLLSRSEFETNENRMSSSDPWNAQTKHQMGRSKGGGEGWISEKNSMQGTMTSSQAMHNPRSLDSITKSPDEWRISDQLGVLESFLVESNSSNASKSAMTPSEFHLRKSTESNISMLDSINVVEEEE